MKTEENARENDMKINYNKTKVMVFNPCWKVDFMPELKFGTDQLELVEEMRLLGVVIQSDMKWTSNTESIERGQQTSCG